LALGATSAFATNGDLMIGQGAKARSMGGTGIAKSFGAESALVNPANISSVKDMEATIAVTYFAPDVKLGSNARANINNALGANGTFAPTGAYTPNDGAPVAGASSDVVMGDSGSGSSVIPEMYFAAKLSEKLAVGLAVAGTAGMGTDYTYETTNGSFGMMTALSLLKVAVPVSYNINGGLTIGAAGVMQYGSLEMKHDTMPSGTRENGAATDIGYGLEFGLNYTNSGFTVGAVYKSAIEMNYEDTISASLNDFGVAGAITSGDSLEQPAERGIGLAYAMGDSTVTADYKVIQWGDAKGYSDFGWENQDVYAVGYEYAPKGWAFRMGYNYAKSPIVEQNGAKGMTATGPQGYVGAVKNFFNMAGFPGIVETHYTIGGAYDISEALTLDGAFIYVPESSESFDTSGLTEGATYNFASNGNTSNQAAAGGIAAMSATSTADVTHSQMALTLALSYRF
ncbi:MAG: outer membrane protein transport protein, partial [Campylobacterota bacterium]|nr:outer membrane protein transport protein [Campylobacterota bacterium]